MARAGSAAGGHTGAAKQQHQPSCVLRRSGGACAPARLSQRTGACSGLLQVAERGRQAVYAHYSVGSGAPAHDVVLSSGFLAFAQHAGFLQAVQEAGVPVGGVMGTSAGALTGSLFAAGYTPKQAAALLSEKAPIQLLQPCFEPWRGGLLSLDGVVERLAELLPPTFEGLEREFAVGVVTADGEHALIDHGPLPEAVAASAAIPFIFSSVDLPGGMAGLKDGGMVDRVGLLAWRERRRQQQQLRSSSGQAAMPPCLVHVIERSSPFSGADDAEASGEEAVQIVRCPKSGVNFFDLGDFDRQFDEARQRASGRLQEYAARLPSLLTSGQQQLGREQQQPQQQPQQRGGVVLGSMRRPAAATAAAAGGAPPASPGSGSSGLMVPPPSSGVLGAPRSPGSSGRGSARRANEE